MVDRLSVEEYSLSFISVKISYLRAERSGKACFVHRGRGGGGGVMGIGGDHMVSRATVARPWSPSRVRLDGSRYGLARTANSRPRGIS